MWFEARLARPRCRVCGHYDRVMRLRLMVAVFLVGVTAGMVAIAPDAPAQSDLDAARAEVSEVTGRLEELLDRLETTQRRGNDLAGEYWQVESDLELLDQQVERTQADRRELDAERQELLDEVRLIALNQYMSSSNNMFWDDLQTVADREAAEALAELFVGSDQGTLDQLATVQDQYERLRAELESRRAEQQDTLDTVTATQQGLADELEELALIRGALEGELLALENALAELESIEEERLAAADRERLAEERRRAEEAAARAAAAAPVIPTPAPTSTPAPTPTALPTALPTASPETEPTGTPEPTAIPNPQPSQPFATATPVAESTPEATAIPNPQPSEPFATATPVPAPTAAPNPVPNPVPSGGGIVCPLAGPFTHTDDFNAPRAVGGVHRANDLIASTGTPVIAVASGMVDHRNSSVGGLSAHLKGDNGDYYFYTHLNGYENVGAGHVSAGTVIGYVGETGNAPIPHLHFEIHRNGYGNYTNPYGPVRAACGT